MGREQAVVTQLQQQFDQGQGHPAGQAAQLDHQWHAASGPVQASLLGARSGQQLAQSWVLFGAE
ncbi:hypothetical protein D9M68_627890 [compost metagenome]